MVKVLVGSRNPVKVAAVQETFSRFFPDLEVLSFSVPSGVPDQPRGDQIMEGCRNRALELMKINMERGLGADFFVGMEAGMTELKPHWFNFSGACILDRDGREGYGTSPFFQYPEIVLKRLLKGEELGVVADEVLNERNTKQKGGMVGHLTRGTMDRKNYTSQSLIIALIPFLNSELYFNKGEKI